MTPRILNQSDGKWVFEDLAQTLARSLWVDPSEDAGSFNYILGTDEEIKDIAIDSFIPIESIEMSRMTTSCTNLTSDWRSPSGKN